MKQKHKKRKLDKGLRKRINIGLTKVFKLELTKGQKDVNVTERVSSQTKIRSKQKILKVNVVENRGFLLENFNKKTLSILQRKDKYVYRISTNPEKYRENCKNLIYLKSDP